MKNTTIIALAVFWLCGAKCAADSFVFPRSRESLDGSGSVLELFQQSSTTFQQRYFASQFPDTGIGIYITELAFRTDPSNFLNDVNATIPRMTIEMSTYVNTGTSLSPVFSWNNGRDLQVVYDDALVIAVKNNGVLNSFAIRMPLSQPFYYNPLMGDLLVRYDTFGGADTRVDGHGAFGENISHFQGSRQGVLSSLTPVTQFTYIVPEASTKALLLTGWLILFFGARMRRV